MSDIADLLELPSGQQRRTRQRSAARLKSPPPELELPATRLTSDPMRQASTTIAFSTPGQGLLEITREVVGWVGAQGMAEGLLTLFCRHTSASLLIQENAAPEVRSDLAAWLARIAPEDPSAYAHDDEGPDDMPAHLRAAILPVQLSVPLIGGRLALGTWQGIYLFEHRRRAHRRTLALHLLGE
jgi:secondary thiamine-phosphate synthase enzyme